MSSGPAQATKAAADDPPPAPADGDHRRRLLVVAAAAAVLVLYLVTAWAVSGRVPAGTTVAGVDVGGLGHDEATGRLDAAVAALDGSLALGAGDRTARLELAAAGLTLDAEQTVDDLTGFSLSPLALWHQVAGGGSRPARPEPDADRLQAALRASGTSLGTPPGDARVRFQKSGPVLTPATAGTRLDLEAAAAAVVAGWLGGARPLPVPLVPAQPAITQAEGERALTEVAKPAVSGPLTVKVGDDSFRVPADDLAAVLSMVPKQGRLELAVDGRKLHAAVLDAAGGRIGAEPKDARIVLRQGRPTVVPGVNGVTLDAADLAAAVVPALRAPERTATVRTAVEPPKLTTDEAKKLGVKEKISTFSTNLTDNALRTENLRVAARTVDGTLVRPGETFSLNGVLGRRTAAKGYNQAPAISGGRLVNDYGGGVSQMATTIFNNVFFSGLEDVYHKPHSFYISRYPEGREATVNYPTVDLKWRNDSKTAVLIAASVGRQVTVSFYGTKTWNITATKSGRSNFRTPKTVYDDKPGCVPQDANGGFDVTVGRIFHRPGSSAVVKRESFTAVYNAEDRVVCGPKPKSAD